MMKNINATILFQIFSTIVFLALLIGFYTNLIHGPAVPTVLASLLSTFFGASFAFHLNSKKDSQKQDEKKIAALRIAQFVLIQQQSALNNAWTQIHQWKDEPYKSLVMQPWGMPDYKNLRQDFPALSFILTDNPQLLLLLSVEDDRFAQTLVALDRYEKFHLDELQPAVEKCQIRGRDLSLPEIVNAIGERIFETANRAADDIFLHLIATRASLTEIYQPLFDYAKSMFPKEKFLTPSAPDDAKNALAS